MEDQESNPQPHTPHPAALTRKTFNCGYLFPSHPSKCSGPHCPANLTMCSCSCLVQQAVAARPLLGVRAHRRGTLAALFGTKSLLSTKHMLLNSEMQCLQGHRVLHTTVDHLSALLLLLLPSVGAALHTTAYHPANSWRVIRGVCRSDSAGCGGAGCCHLGGGGEGLGHQSEHCVLFCKKFLMVSQNDLFNGLAPPALQWTCKIKRWRQQMFQATQAKPRFTCQKNKVLERCEEQWRA